MAEFWDLYDINKNPIGKTHERGKELNDGEFHLVVEIILVNLKGERLITRRHQNKNFGGKWEWQGGSVFAGENSIAGAIRELSEESGITVTKDQISYKGTIIVVKVHTIYDCCFAKKEFSESDIILQKGETVDYKIVSLDKIKNMISSGEFLDLLYYKHRSAWGEELDFFTNI